jgi:transcriptional regulator with XRE-family HTH domain
MKWNDDPEELQKHRKRLGLTQAELSDKCGVAPEIIANIEAGQHPLTGPVANALWDALASTDIERMPRLRHLLPPKDPAARAEWDAKMGTPVSLETLNERPEQFDRELRSLRRSAQDLLRIHASLSQNQENLLKLYEQDANRLTDSGKEIRLNVIELLSTIRRQLREDLEDSVKTLEEFNG